MNYIELIQGINNAFIKSEQENDKNDRMRLMIGHIKMGRFEYIKWRGLQKDGSEDFLLFYEVDLDNDRYATRMIEIYKDGSVNPVVEEDFEFITEAPVPTIEEINTDPEWHAELISEIEFEKIYVSSHYIDDRKKLYLKIIEDVALEISVSSFWRKQIFESNGKPIKISSFDVQFLPEYIKEDITKNELSFRVKVVDECDERFDDGLIIFKFYSEEYPDVIAYSGNNPDVI